MNDRRQQDTLENELWEQGQLRADPAFGKWLDQVEKTSHAERRQEERAWPKNNGLERLQKNEVQGKPAKES